jgi:hypothetical protein
MASCSSRRICPVDLNLPPGQPRTSRPSFEWLRPISRAHQCHKYNIRRVWRIRRAIDGETRRFFPGRNGHGDNNDYNASSNHTKAIQEGLPVQQFQNDQDTQWLARLSQPPADSDPKPDRSHALHQDRVPSVRDRSSNRARCRSS